MKRRHRKVGAATAGPDDRRVALHEAAHAVAGWVVSDRPLLDIELGLDRSGLTRRESIVADGPDDVLLRARVERAAVALLAGPETDARANVRDWLRLPDRRQIGPEYVFRGNWCRHHRLSDEDHVDKLLEFVILDEPRRTLLARLLAVSRLVVNAQWETIGAVATLLQQERRLAGPDVELYLDAHAKRGCFEDLLSSSGTHTR